MKKTKTALGNLFFCEKKRTIQLKPPPQKKRAEQRLKRETGITSSFRRQEKRTFKQTFCFGFWMIFLNTIYLEFLVHAHSAIASALGNARSGDNAEDTLNKISFSKQKKLSSFCLFLEPWGKAARRVQEGICWWEHRCQCRLLQNKKKKKNLRPQTKTSQQTRFVSFGM